MEIRFQGVITLGTVKRPDRQNSAAGLPESEAVTGRRDGQNLDRLDVYSRP